MHAPPEAEARLPAFAYSDDFATPRMGVQWSFCAGDEADRDRYRYENGALVLGGRAPAHPTTRRYGS
jgi:hypothetical protein